MRLLHWLSVGVICFGTQTISETVRVVSGEHPTFTRLVLYFDGPASWEIQRSDEGHTIEFDRQGLTFELGTVFDRIPRTRLQNVSYVEETEALKVEHDCDCDLEVFSVGRGIVAIDVRGEASDLRAKISRPKPNPNSRNPLQPREEVPLPNMAPVLLPLPALDPTDFNARVGSPLETERSMEFPKDFQLRLGAEVSLALAEGLLRANPDSIVEGASGDVSQVVDISEPSEPPIRIQSAAATAEAAEASKERSCQVFPSLLSDLGVTEDPAGDIYSAQAQLVDSAGRLYEAAVQDLFRTYLRAFLLIEARMIMEEWPEILKTDPVNVSLLSFLEGKQVEFLQAWPHCGANGYLWAILAGAKPKSQAGALETAFLALSYQLQKELLPILEDRMRVLGRPDVMHAIRRGMALADTLRFEDDELATVADPDEALQGPVDDMSLPRDVASRLEDALSKEGPVPQETIELAMSIAVEHKGTSDGAGLEAWAATALMRNGRVSEAFAAWAAVESSGLLSDADARQASFVHEIAHVEEQSTFLTMVFGYAPWGWLQEAQPDAALHMRGRLEALGFEDKDIKSLRLSGDAMVDGMQTSRVETDMQDPDVMRETDGDQEPTTMEVAQTDAQEPATEAANQPPKEKDIQEDLAALQEQFTESLAALESTDAQDFGLQSTSELLDASQRARALLEELSAASLQP